MGMEKYERFVRRTRNVLTYDLGWSRDNHTGGWRALRPVTIEGKCNSCDLCWLYCPDSCIERGTIEIDYTYCKGCGICVEECHRGALVMEREGE